MSTDVMTGVRPVPQRAAMRLRVREAIAGYLFLSPWIIGLICFIAGPMMASGYLSFTRYDMVNTPEWVGLKNFVEIFTKDRLFWPSMMLTFQYALIVVPFSLIGFPVGRSTAKPGPTWHNVVPNLLLLASSHAHRSGGSALGLDL